MLIHLTDSSNSSTKGVLDTRDSSAAQDLLSGGQHNFFIANALCSDRPEVIFDLSEPPSFSDEPMIWGQLDEDGSLGLFLAPQTGDKSFPFARLDDCRRSLELFAQGQNSPGGSGNLTRSNVLPPGIDWGLSP